jgi:DNA-binding XRE family transcriptional regulator
MKEKKKIITLEEFKEKNYGKRGIKRRDELEAGYENFKVGILLQEIRHKKGLTQIELAEKIGTNKSYISRIENGRTEPKISTFYRIVSALGRSVELVPV